MSACTDPGEESTDEASMYFLMSSGYRAEVAATRLKHAGVDAYAARPRPTGEHLVLVTAEERDAVRILEVTRQVDPSAFQLR